MTRVDVLIPTHRRKTALATTLAGLFGQTSHDFDVVVSDQTEGDSPLESPELVTLARAFRLRGQRVRYLRHLPKRGLAEHRHFLLEQATAPYVLYVDDDLLLEPWVVKNMLSTIQAEGCGFVGMAVSGLQHVHDVRPHEQEIELWDGSVRPERYSFETAPMYRYKLHNAANPLHLSWRFAGQGIVRYRIAWVGACAMYDREKLLDCGGYSWWSELPVEHAGEDVLAQMLVANRYGGCGILPSGVYHLELPTEVPNREANTNELLSRYLSQRREVMSERDELRAEEEEEQGAARGKAA
jgi:GT2 family glycosyltransferase